MSGLDGWDVRIVSADDPENYMPVRDGVEGCPFICPPGGPSDGCEFHCAWYAGELEDWTIEDARALVARLFPEQAPPMGCAEFDTRPDYRPDTRDEERGR